MPHQQRSEETRTHILQAALECFSHAGYDASGVAEICAAAGVSKGAFYHHFPSKQAVFIELLERWLAGLDTSFSEIRALSGTIPEALRAMASSMRQVYQDARGQLPMFLEFWTQAARDPAVWQITVEPYERYQAYFAGLICDGIAEGSLRPVDPQAAARALIALAIGLLVQGMADAGSSSWPETTIRSIEYLLKGIEVKGE
jgi:AcrR family transcriptional regulator